MKLYFKDKLNIYYFLIIVGLGSLLGFYYYNSQKVKPSSDLVEHTQVVLHLSNEVLLDIITIETGARGYILTGNETFLVPFYPALNNIQNKLNNLKTLIKDNPKQQIKVDSIINTRIARKTVIQNILSDKKNKSLSVENRDQFINESLALNALIRNRIYSFNQEEFRLLELRKAEIEAIHKYSNLLFLLLLFSLLFIFASVVYIIKNQQNKIKFDEKLKETERLYHEMIYTSTSMFAILQGPEMIIKIANEAILNSWGKGNNIIGKSIFSVLPEIVEQGFGKILQTVYQTGELYTSYETPVDIVRNGHNEIVYYSFTYQPQHNSEGQIAGIAIIANEVTSQAIINKKLKESEQHFRLISDLMPEKVTNATPEGNVSYYNKSWQDYTGASFDELVRDGWTKWIHKDELAETTDRWEKSLKTGADFDMVLRMLNHNGQYRWHKSTARAIKDESGKTKLWVGFNADIHDQELQKVSFEETVANKTSELEKATEELFHKNEEVEDAKAKLMTEYSRRLIETSLDPLITIGTKGKIMDMNQAWSDATGKTRKELIGSEFYDYFTDKEKAKNIYKEVFAKGFVYDFPLIIKDHKQTAVLFNGSAYKDENGAILGAVVVARDITVQNKIEKELIEAKLFAEMATNIAETSQLKAETATEIAEEAVRTKQQFLSNMSHEIRTPMNAIIGFTKVVLKTNLTAKQKEYMSAIKISGDALIVLINDIHDLAKVEAGKMTFEQIPFKLHLSIEAMINLFEPRIKEKNLALVKKYDKNIPEILIGDVVRLHQIIMNLMGNALKFTSEGKISIEVKMIDDNDDKATIQFAISDTGIGIAVDKLEGVFEKFNQASISTSRLYGGTGLGLAIVKQLVENQGGSIAIKSEVGVGSTFSFILTFQKAKEEVVLQPEIMELDGEIRDVKVLVVEDMELNQLLMKTLLDEFGFECDITFNGKLAIEKLALTYENQDIVVDERSRIKPYDIILMDLQMPEMNGFEATSHIRNIMKSDIPIIALTADVTTADVEKCKAIGMNDYVSKPVNERLLYSKIVALVKKPVIMITSEKEIERNIKPKAVDLSYLLQRTKSNPKLMIEMLTVYLEQTPPLLFAMKQSLKNKDWKLLEQAVHKMIPSFSIIGMSTDFENMARKIQEYANTQQMTESIQELVTQLDEACTQACMEMEIELKKLKETEK